MTEDLREEDILARAEAGLRDAVEARNMKWGAGTKVKRQKYIDLALDHYIGRISTPQGQRSPVTRNWYKYGCVQSASTSNTPFEPDTAPDQPQTLAGSIESGVQEEDVRDDQDEFEPPQEKIVETGDDSSVPIEEHEIAAIEENDYFDFFYKERLTPALDKEHWVQMSNLEFLREYYTHKAPPGLQSLYLANVELRQSLKEAYETAKLIEQNRTEFLVGEGDIDVKWSPERFAERIGRASANLRLSLYASKYVPDSLVKDVMSFTDLLEDFLDGLAELQETDIRPIHYRSLKELDEFLDEPIWEWIARYISYSTVVGPGAESWRKASREEIIRFEATCGEQINELRERYERDGLLASVSAYRTDPSNKAEQLMSVIDEATIRQRATPVDDEDDINE